jgi:hypothetical protein
MNFINESMKSIIKKGLDDLYINLNSNHKEIIYFYTEKLIEFIAYQYNFSKTNYEYEFIQNNYKNVKWLSTLLLPYLNVSQTELKSFDDMYKEKSNKLCKINEEEPMYIFTNIQYNRCLREYVDNKIKYTEIDFNESHIKQNFLLLCKSLLSCSHKLYVNWINIIPYTISERLETTLYLNTQELFKFGKLNDIVIDDILKTDLTDEQKNKLSKNLHSIYVGDIYNTLRIYLYEEIKNIKFLIFDLVIQPINQLHPAITILQELFYDDGIFVLTYALNDINWNNLDEKIQNIFINKLTSLFDAFIKKKSYKIINPSPGDESIATYDIAAGSIQRLVKGILINFDNKYRNRKEIINSGYKSIQTNIPEEDKELIDEDNIDGYDFKQIDETIQSIKPEFIYVFLKEILQEFKTTFYSRTLLTEDKKDIIEATKNDFNFTLKNLYNFAKSLSYVSINKKYIPLNRNWVSLNNSEKKLILDRLNNKIADPLAWFNIKGYIRSLIDIGYEFTLPGTIDNHNRTLYGEIREKLISVIFEILITKGVLSKFILNRELTDLNLIGNNRVTDYVAANIKNTLLKKSDTNPYYYDANYYLTDLPYKFSGNYFDELAKSTWTSMDPLEWVSQIGFCHHYINNRVSFVSGATGVGKSTHVPKLFMYNLKAIDYKSSGKVVCTQPRKTPTEKNAEQVSTQLGLNILDLAKSDIIKQYTTNYYVQMQHKDKKHTKNNKHLILKFITDGSLAEEFKNLLPVFKKQIGDKVTPENVYDVIIIDEAHEHNKNMDILLTIMKLFVYYNPTIRLVILSATLDEDEPTYRRFYRAINDNMKYPYDLSLKQLKLDRINIDRRYHISPPGAGTRFKVNEFYEEKADMIDLIKRLIKTKKGDILVFQPGEGDITKLIEELNKTIESNWIALPFYSSMNDEKKDFIQDIDRTFPKLRMDRNLNFNDTKNIYDGNNEYTNFVLIATNIAEASITINRLYYVIDTGTRKINYYDYKRRNYKLLTQFISETSRVQRKGRVGRTGPGDAYFVYKKGTTTNNKTPYLISIENIGSDIYSRIRNSTDENAFNIDEYINILRQFYYTSDGKYDYIGFENNEKFDYVPKFYKSGYDIEDIIDRRGQFYIVHPDELNLCRNIGGQIINTKTPDEIEFINKESGIIKSRKIDSFIEDYITTNFLTETFNKTELGININEMSSKLMLTSINNSIALIYGLLFTNDINTQQYNDLLIGIVSLDVINGDITSIVKQDKENNKIINKILDKNANSDIEIIVNNINKVLSYIKSFDLFNIEKSILDGDVELDNFKNIDKKKLLNAYRDRTDYDNKEIELDEFINKISNTIYKKLLKSPKLNNALQQICNQLELDIDMIIKIIKQYIQIKETIKNLFYSDKRDKNYTNFIEKYRKEFFIKNYNHYDLIKLSLLCAQPYNICLNIVQTNAYLPLYNPNPEYIMNINMIKAFNEFGGKKKYILSSFIGDRFLRGYCYFNNYDAIRDSIMCIFNFNIDLIVKLQLFRNIYNKDKLKELTTRYSYKIQKYIDKLSAEQKLKLTLSKDYDKIINSHKAFEQIISDLL